jgi:hypothetical protein
MAFRVYREGTETEAGSCVDVGAGGTVAVIAGAFAGGPKGVGEGEASRLTVTIGLMAVGADGPGPVHAVRRKRNARSM